MRYLLKKTVAMVGMMGAGKTAVGQALAARLDVPFRDSDAAIVEAANMEIAEIFARDGEAFFRDREAQVIARLLDAAPGVLSTGGGAYLQPRNRVRIGERGVALWLKADLDLLWSRVRHKTTRPLLMTGDPYATLSELYAARVPAYAEAEIVVETRPEYSIAETADHAVAALLTRPDVLEEIP
ncbi:MAG: shikimate kinase [Paracoccaceae bacterium]|nr:shikimate kinase [Paracoccaceae bacterium]